MKLTLKQFLCLAALATGHVVMLADRTSSKSEEFDLEYVVDCALLLATGLTLAGEEKLALFIGGPTWLYSLVSSGLEAQKQKMGPGFPSKPWDEVKLVFGFCACMAITVWNLVSHLKKADHNDEPESRGARRARKEAKAKHQ